MSDTPEQQAKWLVELADFLGEHDASFECNCNPTIEWDVNASICQDRCASHMQDHADIVLRQSAEALLQSAARERGLSLAADQYSESRDYWKQEHGKALAELGRLRSILIAMYQGGESLPSSVFHEVAGWVGE